MDPSGSATTSRVETTADNLVSWAEKFAGEIGDAADDEIRAVYPQVVTALHTLTGALSSFGAPI